MLRRLGLLLTLTLLAAITTQSDIPRATVKTTLAQTIGDILVDDFENVDDWSGLVLESATVKAGSAAGRWEKHEETSSVSKAFDDPLDVSSANHLQLWLFSAVANGAPIELIFDSDNDADPAGWDYYIHRITVDWTGWRLIRIPLDHFRVARNPVGWHQINHVRLSANGWGHEPMPDTELVLDDMRFGAGVIDDVRVDTGYVGRDFVFGYTLRLVNRQATAREVELAVAPDSPCRWPVRVPSKPVQLPSYGSVEAIVEVTVPESMIVPSSALQSCSHDLLAIENWTVADGVTLESAVPLPSAPRPRLLLDGEDLVRMARWAGEHSWARDVRDGIVASAESWPESFEQRYYLDEWSLPPEGGQWGMWYICPDHGVSLRHEGPGRHVCPVDGSVHTGWPYDQVIYARMHNGLASAAFDLALSYRMTGRSEFAAAAAEILMAYAERYLQYPIHNVQGEASGSGAHVLSQTLDESAWIIRMAWAYDLVADDEMFSPENRSRIEHGMLRPAADLISRNPAGKSNWQSWHNAAIGAVGFGLQDPVLVGRALNHPTNGFDFQMENSVSSDGFWYEGAWGYHFFALQAHRYLAEMASRAGLDLYDTAALRSMFDGPLAFAMPDGSLPPFNDSRSVSLVGQDRLFESAFRQYGADSLASMLGQRPRRREALYWGAETLVDGTAADLESTLFADSGYAVMRAGKGSDQTYVALDYGPHGGGHGHYDKLGFVLHARGATMAIDPGTQSYAAPTHKTWDKETVAHNTVVVDGKTQSDATGRLHRFVALPSLAMAAADDGEANESADLMRTMIVSPDYVVDRVHAVATDDAEHTVDWMFHGFASQTSSVPDGKPIELPDDNGYQHLSERKFGDGSEDWTTRFDQQAPLGEEYGGAWANEGDIEASFTRSDEQAASGAGSGKLEYDFSGASGYIVFSTDRPQERDRAPTDLGLSLYGDGSGNSVTLRACDSTDERFVYRVGPVDWLGWREITATNVISWSHYLGNDDGVFDPPVNSIAVQLNHEDGRNESGALYVDDITLAYGSGDEDVVADFEHQPVGLNVWMLGQDDTTVVTGTGLGPDLLEPLPFVMARRTQADTVFTTLLEPMGEAPNITGFGAQATDAAAEDEVVALIVGTADWGDMLLAVADGAAGRMRSFGPAACDGVLCLFRAVGGGPTGRVRIGRLVLAEGSILQADEEHPLLTVEGGVDAIQVDFEEDGFLLDITLSGAVSGELRIRAADATEVILNGGPTEFHRDGAYVVLGGFTAPSVYLPMVMPGS